jgi:hypothetical protein
MPPACLSMNGRAHWAVKNKATKAARSRAWFETVNAGGEGHSWPAATIKYEFVFTENRARDDDNFITRMKPIRDGIADAGLVVNDSVFTTLPAVLRVDRTAKEPHVIVTITKGTP